MLAFITGLSLLASIASAEPPPEMPLEASKLTVDESLSEEAIKLLATHYALIYGVSAEEMIGTIKCESAFNQEAIGDGGQSRGLAQIHRPSWPHISDEEAMTPDFAIRFMAEQFSEGNQRAWTCWRNLYAV